MKILSRKNKCLEKNNNVIQFFQMIHSNTNIKTKWKNTGFLAVFIIVSVLCSMSTAYAELPSEVKKDELIIADIQSIDLNESYFFSNEFLIKVEDSSKKTIKESLKPEDTGIATLNNLNKKHSVLKFEPLVKHGVGSKKDTPLSNWYIVTLKTPKEKITKKSDQFVKFKKIMDSYQNDPNIKVVEPNYLITILTIPDDPYYSSSNSWGQSYQDLWGIRKINSEYAWDQNIGSSSIVVANIDTGVDRNHADLKDNMWVNTNEIPDNGIDDDANGYIDDYYGWDWVNNDNDPMDDHGHGTHTAGTIAGVGNNGNGVVGVNWNSQIMALKFLNSAGSGSLSDAVLALQYAADMGAKVSSNSWGSAGSNELLDDAIQYEHDKGMVVVVAAGNSNADALGYSPASADRAITVAASDYNDVKASFSNWGQKIDVTAPGVDILSTKASINNMCTPARGNIVGTDYCRVSGTSMATPHVAGLAALILAENPDLSNEEVRQIIRAGAVDLGVDGKDRDFGYGRIDANGSISISNLRPLAPIITSPESRTVICGDAFEITGSISGPDFTNYKLEVGTGRTPSTWDTLATSTTKVTNGVIASVDTTQMADGMYIFRLTAKDINGEIYQFQVHDITVDNFEARITYPTVSVFGKVIDVTGTAQTKNGIPFESYELEYGPGTSPTFWSTDGITLVHNGTQPVVNGKMGSWDTSLLNNDAIYTLRLTVKGTDGHSEVGYVSVKVDKDILSGWPKDLGIGNLYDTPAVADLNNDGQEEIIIAPYGQKLVFAFEKDGSNLTGWPVTLNNPINTLNSFAISDVNGDGTKEIIIQHGIIEILKYDGTSLPGWPQSVPYARGTPSVGDLDGDGTKEIVVISQNMFKSTLEIYAFNSDGTTVTGFPKKIFESASTTSTSYSYYYLNLIDLEGDGKMEMILSPKLLNIDKIYVLDYQGNIKSGWPQIISGFEIDRTLAGDITGDGMAEVIVYYSSPKTSGETTYLTVFDMDGNQLPGWPQEAARSVSRMGPALADATGDGILDIVLPMYGIGSGDTKFDCSPLVYTKEGLQSNPSCYYGHDNLPAVVDFNGDGQPNVVTTSSSFRAINVMEKFYDSTGNLGWKVLWEKKPGKIQIQPVVSDMDKNGKWEIIGMVETSTGTSIYVWEPPASNSQNGPAWSQYINDETRSGSFLSINREETPSPTT